MSPPALETRGLCKSFGALPVANDIDFRLERGARHALIGPNGAGKTSFVNLVTGALRPSAGRILLDGADITALAAGRAGQARPRPHLPDHRAVPPPERARERDPRDLRARRGRRRSVARRPGITAPPSRKPTRCSSGSASPTTRCAPVDDARLWAPAAGRDRRGARPRAQGAAARRAGGRRAVGRDRPDHRGDREACRPTSPC